MDGHDHSNLCVVRNKRRRKCPSSFIYEAGQTGPPALRGAVAGPLEAEARLGPKSGHGG